MKNVKVSAAILVSLAWCAPGFAASYDIIQNDKKFDKTEIKIKAGDTIVFKNTEKDITHNVFSLGPTNAFELKTQAPGSSSPVKFDKKGTTDVECAIHTNMKLKVTVE
jgi:plastocyanin